MTVSSCRAARKVALSVRASRMTVNRALASGWSTVSTSMVDTVTADSARPHLRGSEEPRRGRAADLRCPRESLPGNGDRGLGHRREQQLQSVRDAVEREVAGPEGPPVEHPGHGDLDVGRGGVEPAAEVHADRDV